METSVNQMTSLLPSSKIAKNGRILKQASYLLTSDVWLTHPHRSLPYSL